MPKKTLLSNPVFLMTLCMRKRQILTRVLMVVCQNRLQGLLLHKKDRRLVHGKKAVQIFAQGASTSNI